MILSPSSVAIIGASDDPNKVGGRPLLYLSRFGYRGRVYAVNPNREAVQGLAAWRDVASLPEAPDVAIVAVPREQAAGAVAACARRGAKAAIVMTSGFAEVSAAGRAAQEAMVRCARDAGMRLVGPNSQGLANFASGAVASFSTIFLESPPEDGPVAIVSQSGALGSAIFGRLRDQGIGVRHVHATGNDADVTVSEVARWVVDDPGVRLVLLYAEQLPDLEHLEAAADRARSRGIPIVALKTGRTPRGQAAAAAHTGARADDDAAVDRFFRAHGIHRVDDMQGLVLAGAGTSGGSGEPGGAGRSASSGGQRPRPSRAEDLKIRGEGSASVRAGGGAPAPVKKGRDGESEPRSGCSLVVISNSGACGVMAADAAGQHGLTLAEFDDATKAALGKRLPAFASVVNPVDLTAALMTDSRLLGAVLPVLAAARGADLFLVGIIVAGAGYDIGALVNDTAAFAARVKRPVAVVAPQPAIAERFRAAGVAAFENQTDAMRALGQAARSEPLNGLPQSTQSPQRS